MGKPKIRFKGYTDEWEQRKLGEVIEDYVEKTTVENQYPVLTSSQQMGIVLQDDYFSGDRVSQSGNIGYFVIPRGYFAYRSRSDNDVFVFNRNDCIDKGSISYFYPVFKPSGVDSDFLLRRLNYGLETQLKIASEGTGQHVLSLKKFKNMTALFPSINEQRKIGEYFTRLDHLITLHQRKYEQAKTLKKYMLQKMFPQDGMRVPEIRFAGFTDEWEQRKFGDIGSVSMCKRVFKDETSAEGEIPFFKIGTFGGDPDAYISKKLFEEYKEKFSYPEVGDILLSASGTIGRIVEYKGEAAYFQDSNIVWLSHDNSISNKFLKVLYPTVKWDGIEGSTIKRLYNDNFLKTKFMMPQIGEQERIGAYFEYLDHLITLHQRKCDELRKIKKYMLQNMFC